MSFFQMPLIVVIFLQDFFSLLQMVNMPMEGCFVATGANWGAREKGG